MFSIYRQLRSFTLLFFLFFSFSIFLYFDFFTFFFFFFIYTFLSLFFLPFFFFSSLYFLFLLFSIPYLKSFFPSKTDPSPIFTLAITQIHHGNSPPFISLSIICSINTPKRYQICKGVYGKGSRANWS